MLIKITQLLWLASGLLLAAVSLCLPVTAMQPFWFGYFFQAEPTAVAFLGLGCLTLMWLLWTYKKHPTLVNYALAYPVVWGMLLLAFLSIVFSFFHASILQTWFGTPQLNEGGVTFLVQAIIAALFIVLLKIPKTKHWLLAIAILTGSIIAILAFLGGQLSPWPSLRDWKWMPYYFPDYLAYIGLALFGYFIAIWQQERENRSVANYLICLSLLAMAIFVSYVSENKSLWYGFYIAVAVVFASKVILRSKTKTLLPWAVVALAVSFVVVLSFFQEITNLLDVTENSTLITRGRLLRFTFANSFSSDFWDIYDTLFGRGWGSYADFFTKNLFSIPDVTLFSHEKFVGSKNEITNRDFFHSHNVLTEAFSALGIIGLLVVCIYFFYLTKSLRKSNIILGYIFLITYILLNSFWFQVMTTIPFSILAIAAVTRPLQLCKIKIFKPKHYYTVSCLAVIMLGAFTGIFFVVAKEMTKITNISIDKDPAANMDTIIDNRYASLDRYIGNRRMVLVLRSKTLNSFLQAEYTKYPPQKMVDVLLSNTKAADYLYKNSAKCRITDNCLAALNIYSELASTELLGALFEQNQQFINNWHNIAGNVLTKVPSRTDMLIPYISYWVLRDKRRAFKIVYNILDHKNDDPVGLWFLGAMQLDEPGKLRLAFSNLNLSLDKGIARFMSLSKEQIEQIRTQK